MNFSALETATPRGFLTLDNYAGLSASHPWVNVCSTSNTGGVFDEWMMLFILGANSSTSITFKLQQAKDGLGAGVKDVPGKVKVFAEPATSQRMFLIGCRSDQLDTANGYKFLRARIEVTGGTTTNITGVLFGFEPVNGTASKHAITEAILVGN